MDKYPTLSLTELQKIKTVIQNATGDNRYLDGRICPYDKQTRDLIKTLVIPVNPVVAATVSEEARKVGAPKKTPVLPLSELEKEFDELRKEINTLKADAKGLEPHERIQVVKTRAALVEKILTMKERINNMKRNANFIATVIEIMEAEVPQENRLRIIEKLEPFIEEE